MPLRLALVLVLCCALASAVAQDPSPSGPGRPTQDPSAVTIRGTCTTSESGLPLPGVEITARRADEPDGAWRPRSVTTGRDGEFVLELETRPGWRVELRAERAGRETQIGDAKQLRPGATYRADAALPLGAVVTGLVVDADGAPLSLPIRLWRMAPAGAPTWPARPATGPSPPVRPHRGFVPSLSATAVAGVVVMRAPIHEAKSDDAGRLAFVGRVALGRYRVASRLPGFVPEEPRSIDVSAGVPGAGLPRLVFAGRPRIRGIVVDDAGQPVPGVILSAAQTRYGPAMRAETDEGGHFTIVRAQHAVDPAELRFESTPTCEPREVARTFKWGDENVRLELERSPSVALQVVLAESGDPVTAFAVRAYPRRAIRREFDLSRLRLPGPHPQGRVEIDGVRMGPGRIVAVPDDPTLLPAGIDVVGTHGMAPVQIAVRRLVPNAIAIVDRRGDPVADAEVRVVVPGTARRSKALLDTREEIVRARSDEPGESFDTIIYRATTNASGRCVVYGIEGQEDLELDVVRGRRKFGRFRGVRFGGVAMPFVVEVR